MVHKRKIKNGALYILLIFAQFELATFFLEGEFFQIAQKAILLGIILLCIYLSRNEKVFANPYLLFSITPLSLFFYDPSISKYFLTELNRAVYHVAILSFIVFIAVLKITTKEAQNKNIVVKEEGNRKFGRISLFLLIISVLPTIASRVGVSFPLGGFVSAAFYPGIAFSIKSKSRIAKLFMWLVIFIVLASGFNKTLLIAVVMMIISSSFSLKKKSAIKRQLLIVLLVLLGYVFLVYIFPLKTYFRMAGSFSGLTNLSVLETINTSAYEQYSSKASWSFSNALLIPYLVFATPWTNLNYVLSTQSGLTYGMWFLRPYLGFMQIDYSKLANIYSLQPLQGSFNTFGFLTVQIKDFGYLGAIAITGLVAWFVGYTYKKYVLNINSPIEIAKYGLVACAVAEMFFSNHFFMQGYTQIIYIISWIILSVIKHMNRKLYLELAKKKIE